MSIFHTLACCSVAVSQCSVIGQVQKNLRPTGHFIDIYFHGKRRKRCSSRPQHHQIWTYILFHLFLLVRIPKVAQHAKMGLLE